MAKYENDVASYAVKLDALSPLRIISKGYCIASDKNDLPVTSAYSLKENDKINLIFADGKVSCTVNGTDI